MSILAHSPGEIRRHAEIVGPYRYLLTRRWDSSLPMLAVVMLNPSTADALDDDPTVRWLMSFARRHQYGGIEVVNLFALRSSDPTALLRHADPVGPQNAYWLRRVIRHTAARMGWLLVGWGDGGARVPGYAQRVSALCDVATEFGVEVMALGKTKGGAPWHPLRRRLDTIPTVWRP